MNRSPNPFPRFDLYLLFCLFFDGYLLAALLSSVIIDDLKEVVFRASYIVMMVFIQLVIRQSDLSDW